MREIKFRAWDDRKKKWLLGYEHKELGGFSLFGELVAFGEWGAVMETYLFDRASHKAQDLKVMQYTGLKDKNGKEIYEGDYCVSNHHQFGELEEGVVEYAHTGQYVLAQGSFKVSVHDIVFNDWTLEAIGNIYENPELLKKK